MNRKGKFIEIKMKKILLISIGIIIGLSALFGMSGSIYEIIYDSYYYDEIYDTGEYLWAIYKGLLRKNPDMPNYDEFRFDMQHNEQARRVVYNGLKSKNPDMPNFEIFSRRIGVGRKNVREQYGGFDFSGFDVDDEKSVIPLSNLTPFNYKEAQRLRICWDGILFSFVIFFLSSLMLYFLIKTKFGVKIYLENKANNELKKIKNEIKKIEHEIKKVQLISKNCILTKELDKIC